LRAAFATAGETERRDIEEQLDRLGVHTTPKATRKPDASSLTTAQIVGPMSVEELHVGRTYRRSSLHDGGLGGSRQTGISYSANGTYALLFSDPSKASEWGYRDAPVGEDGYRFFGHWYGSGDMRMERGNRVVRDRSPELYLFTESPGGYQYRGQFECLDWDWERTPRDGRDHQAIVFTLKRVG
jgi:hypothetical protein